MDQKLQKIYLLYCNLLTVQYLRQAHYQILSLIFLGEFIELNVCTHMMIKNVKLVEYKNCDWFLEYSNFEDDLIEYKCLIYNKNYQTKFDEKLKEGFVKTCTFSNHNINKFILLL